METVEVEEELRRIKDKHREVFRPEIGRVSHYEHEIKIINKKAYKFKTYPIPDVHKGKVREHLLELEELGIIKKEATQYINPLVVVIKKNGEIRMCLDARELNKRMVNAHDQPPTIDEVFRRIGRRKYFTTLDIAKAFWQIPLKKEDQQYTGFMFNNQSYVFRRMPFGIKTAGASFTRAMNGALGNECHEFTIVYLDDILIASNSLEEHLEHIEHVLKKLKIAGFRLNLEKFEFMQKQIRFLGHIFSEIQAEMNNDTKLAIRNFERPKNKKALQAFLGLINWDRRFIKNLANMTQSLEKLLKKDTKFVWGQEQQQAFKEIKAAFDDAPALFTIRVGMRFGLFVDASKSGLGARLYQYDHENPDKRYTIAYASRSLKGTEKNYTITELECLAIVWALKKWHTTLLGRHIKIYTDHRALKFLTACADDSARITRWIAFLQEFDLEIEHIAGKENTIADSLSRMHSKGTDVERREEARIIALIRSKPDDEVETSNWVKLIQEEQKIDEALQEEKRLFPQQLYDREGLTRIVTRNEERIIVPDKLSWTMIRKIHEYILHFGTDKVIDFANRYFIINNMDRITRDVVASCEICHATKYYMRPTRGIEYYVLPERPGHTVSMDIFGPLPQTPKGNKYVLVLMDQFSKLTKLYPMKNQKLETIMDILQTKYCATNGFPEEILTDNGGQFLTDRWREFGVDMGFFIRKTSPYNPQSNPVERVMREIGRIVRAYAHDEQTKWDRIIERAEKTINETEHRSTGYRPIELHENMQEEIKIDPSLKPETKRENEVIGIQERINNAAKRLEKRAKERKRQADKHGEAEQYSPGKKVWIKLHRRSDANRRITRKIHLVYDEPYRIKREVRRNAYVIEDMKGNVVGTYNSRQLRPNREAK